MIPSHRNQSVNVHQFAMVPKAEVPRSSFLRQHTHKTTFDENYLVPIYVDEVLPGDTFSLSMTAFARLTTPIFPVMDNMYLDSFFFFVPCRILWNNWVKLMGEQANPGDSIAFTVPSFTSPVGGWITNSLHDYFGLPCVGQVGGAATVAGVNSLPFRAYNKIWNDWFRDENLQTAAFMDATQDTDSSGNYALLKRGKRHDYFTSCLPWTQKGGASITVPIAGSAIVKTSSAANYTGVQQAVQWLQSTTGTGFSNNSTVMNGSQLRTSVTATGASTETGAYPTNLYADLSTATSVTINQLRQSFQIQKLLERDARGGTRYVELIRAHWGVVNPDFRLQRSEYLGGGTTAVNISPIPQTDHTPTVGTPLGTLAAYGTMLTKGHGFTQSFTEHGYVIGLANIRADITYQQGLRKLWSRATRYDFYFPAFAMLGEQAVLNKEIYTDGSANDALTFGFNERWAEYRYFPSMITGQFKSYYATPLDAWHLAEKFTALPTLAATFITANAPVPRVSAVPVTGSHFIFDGFFNIKTTRAMPLYSVPGLIDHF
ncbi:MAG: major capsid protein [Microviridae sp.]|nr:MAG: major capsid protein [Microviridae sp.]